MGTTTPGRLFARNTPTVLGWCVLLFSGIVVWLTSGFEPIGEEIRTWPPSFFPFALAAFMALLAVLLLVEGYRKKNGPILGLSFGKNDYLRALLLLAAMVLYTFAQKLLGFLIPSVLLVAAMQLILGGRKVIPILISSISIPGIIYFLFYILLNVPLPEGMW
jgi:putative tricarboxylic transport membrane protein